MEIEIKKKEQTMICTEEFKLNNEINKNLNAYNLLIYRHLYYIIVHKFSLKGAK